SDWRNQFLSCSRAPRVPLRGSVDCAAEVVTADDRAARENLKAIVDRISIAKPGYTFEVRSSRDAVMNSGRIMCDLAASAARFGVEVLLGYRIDPESIQVPKY